MKKSFSHLGKVAIITTFCLTAWSLSSSAQDKSTTVTGEVLDMHCYMSMDAHGDGHKSCAAKCIQGGSPMGVLTSDGKVYLLLEDDAKKDAFDEAKKHAGEQVTVTGTVSEKDGIKAMVVTDVKGKS